MNEHASSQCVGFGVNGFAVGSPGLWLGP
ncbi:hypothetical protein QZH41_017173 [Actinostola sp. cb2023]|nr:hypothetical protein QZH41_017173 [Actinostola sp. cb2023]